MNKITFEIEGVEYRIPNSINIANYVKLYKFNGLFEDEYFQVKLINILTGAPLDKLMDSDHGKIKFLSNVILDIIPTDKPAFLDRFELDGIQYGFIPDWKKMSFGEFADLDTLIGKPTQERLDYLHIITAILYRPITKEKSKHKFEIEKYNDSSLEERAELFKNKLDVEIALGGQFFFTLFAQNSLNNTPISLKQWILISWEQIKFAWTWRKILWRIVFKKDLDGSLFLTEYRKTILPNIRKSLSKPS